MNLVYFTKDAYKSLKKDLDANKEKYFSDDPWLDQYFSETGITEYFKKSTIVVPNVSLAYTGDDDVSKKNDDLTNTRILYGAFRGKLTPLQASDPLLWSGLCHLVPEFRKYILQRWAKDDGGVSIKDRFFATEGRAKLCYYNAISRLWWSGYLTFDEDAEKTNPWHLTETLFSAQQIQKDLFDQPMSMNRTIVKGVLSALKKVQSETGNACTPLFRECVWSYLNRYGAVTILDALTSSEIEDIAYSFMEEKIKAK